MDKKYIIALDQGTTSSRSVLFDQEAAICGISQLETKQIFPDKGFVEQDAMEIYNNQIATFQKLILEQHIQTESVAAIGITNQRETTVIWNKQTGIPVYNAIIWQDVRTAKFCKKLINEGHEEYIKRNTGLVIDSYFSATKIKWILDHVPEAREQAKNDDLLFGTIDTWLLWKMTNGKVHATDYSNASRTMLFNINTLEWDEKILDLLNIPKSLLPEVCDSNHRFGTFNYDQNSIPIHGIAGDQQAALFGQNCFEKGEAKNTYGTGCFLLMNTGENPQYSNNGLLTTIAWGLNNKITYALEGSVFIAGAAIQWLRDGLQLIESAKETESISVNLKEESSVFVVPAFSGMGAPYWDMDARGAIFGLTQDTGKNHLIKATLESLAYQSRDLLEAMQEDGSFKLKSLKVDGGACANNYLMQFQSDILDVTIERAEVLESTAQGVAFLAGIGVGFWSLEEISNKRKINREFVPKMEGEQRGRLYKSWKKAVERTLRWEQ